MKAYIIPLLIYGTGALNLSKSDFTKLENYINVAVMKNFEIQDTNNIAFVKHIFAIYFNLSYKSLEFANATFCQDYCLPDYIYNDLFANGL